MAFWNFRFYCVFFYIINFSIICASFTLFKPKKNHQLVLFIPHSIFHSIVTKHYRWWQWRRLWILWVRLALSGYYVCYLMQIKLQRFVYVVVIGLGFGLRCLLLEIEVNGRWAVFARKLWCQALIALPPVDPACPYFPAVFSLKPYDVVLSVVVGYFKVMIVSSEDIVEEFESFGITVKTNQLLEKCKLL